MTRQFLHRNPVRTLYEENIRRMRRLQLTETDGMIRALKPSVSCVRSCAQTKYNTEPGRYSQRTPCWSGIAEVERAGVAIAERTEAIAPLLGASVRDLQPVGIVAARREWRGVHLKRKIRRRRHAEARRQRARPLIEPRNRVMRRIRPDDAVVPVELRRVDAVPEVVRQTSSEPAGHAEVGGRSGASILRPPAIAVAPVGIDVWNHRPARSPSTDAQPHRKRSERNTGPPRVQLSQYDVPAAFTPHRSESTCCFELHVREIPADLRARVVHV